LQKASDAVVWQYAAQQGFAIVTKDADFHQRSFLFGHPPKVI
jgi:predicted nuclease of predicted toxin-antitoxin system